jgi:hypothetical protein
MPMPDRPSLRDWAISESVWPTLETAPIPVMTARRIGWCIPSLFEE